MTEKSPYPGLRPFTEEEAIFFRGREDHVSQIIKSLESKHFVMITGASGDGKSSIVYAGLVPKAKAGFFKAYFNNWEIHTFRPEKSPFKNMCKQVSEALKMEESYVQKELSYGFSSLVKLYKESGLYLDEKSKDFSSLSALERVEKRRSAANLLLIVDQFEEFFTNNENLTNGSPNDSSHLVANLLSHTVSLAKENNIPIYIVTTMRSDYIGSCASLRGIPELIGYSQYFIPRLNRNEIADVIRSPADLNGDKIQNRLVDHLINSSSEGSDQLPIIQHCMNRIWRSADGKDLDLYHLSICQGLNISDLTLEQQEIIDSKSILNDENDKNLNNVINAHASSLFEESITRFLEIYKNYETEKVQENLIFVLKNLVKIDDGKGVRYKVKFGELQNNLTHPMDISQLNILIYLFRKEGNDLLAPYSNQIKSLDRNDPLEISHESLIRNWVSLKKWAELDSQDYQTFKDLRVQCDKWENSNRSKNYLLSIGPLDYFETWIEKTDPTVFWIMKYEQFTIDNKDIKETKTKILKRIIEFLKESRDAINAAQENEKRRRRILLIAASAAVVVLSSITVWAFSEKSLADSAKEVAETQKKNAESATLEAKKSEEKALYMSTLSDSLLNISEENEELANLAKTEALKQKSLAETSRKIAQEKANQAKIQAEKTLKAIDQLLVQKNLTESQRDSANLARMEAYDLSIRAVSKSLALQASSFEINPELSGLMSFHSFDFNRLVNGNESDPSIYSGSNSALGKLKGGNYNLIDDLKFMPNDLLIDNESRHFYAIDNEGFIDTWSFQDGFFNSFKHLGTINLNPNFKALAFDAFILDDNSVAFVDHFGSLSYFNNFKDSNDAIVFSNHDSQIHDVKKYDFNLISSDIKGKLIIQNINGLEANKEFICEEAIMDFTILKDYIIYITRNKCCKVNIKSLEQLSEIPLPGYLRSCLIADNKVIISNNEGTIYQLDENLNVLNGLKFGYLPINHISVNPNQNLLAVGSADKRIGIFNLNEINKDPMIIEKLNHQIRTLVFSKENFLIAGFENGDCRFWSTNIQNNIKEICNNLTRSLSEEEWEKYIGNKIKTRQACKM